MNISTRIVSIVTGAALAATGLGSLASAQVQPTSPVSCATVSHGLKLGHRDFQVQGEVTTLQAFLLAQGYFKQKPIGIFGPATLRAVAEFQRANGIASTGFVGPLTRAAIQRLGCATTPPSSTIEIDAITPASGAVGTTVTLSGRFLSDDNTVHFGSGVIPHVRIASSIAVACTTDPNCKGGIRQTIVFTVPDGLNTACFYSNPRCLMPTRQTTPGIYNVSVENANGTTNTVQFTVTGTSTASPVIRSVTPSAGPIGATVTVTGNGFTSDMILRFAEGSVQHSTSADGTSMTFLVPQGVGPYCAPQMMCAQYLRMVTPGGYAVYVQNVDGTVRSNEVNFTVTSGSSSAGAVSVTGIDAPSTLAMGVSGTWSVHAASPSSNANLHYAVVWGDEQNTAQASIMAPTPTPVQSSASFSHAYQRAGTYTPVFTVTDDAGHTATASATVTITPWY